MTKLQTSSLAEVVPDEPRHFRDLTKKQQDLLRKFQEIGWGVIEDLVFQNGDPVLRPMPKIQRKIKLRKGKGPPRNCRPADDFELKDEHISFFSFLMEQQDGSIDRIEICDGLPAEMSVEEVA
jgi:hypothetical protein